MSAFCPRCGTPFPTDWGATLRMQVQCRACHLAPTDVPRILAPSGDELGYALGDWPVSDRGALTGALVDVDIPYRWEDGLVLVVPAAAAAEVDNLLEDFTGAGEAGTAVGDREDWEEHPDALGAEAAQAAMAELFVAADRLQHAPYDEGAGGELLAATATVTGCPPPYGIEQSVWRRIQDLAFALAADVEEDADAEVVTAHARDLRNFLRDLV
jgi:hypothetical protein